MLLCLHFINVSIDVNRPASWLVKEDLGINKQESLIEFIIEKVLGYQKAMGEYQEPGTDDDGLIKKAASLDLIDIRYHHSILLDLFTDQFAVNYAPMGDEHEVMRSLQAPFRPPLS